MKIVDTLRELARLRIDVIATDGNLTLDAPSGVLSDELVATIKAHKTMLLWAVDAFPSHRWRCCDACGEPQLVEHNRKPRACVMTPKCAGALHPDNTGWRPTVVVA